MFYYLVGIFALSASVAFHELGHLLAARALGVKVDEFSVGFGPSRSLKVGAIKYSMGLIPFGGSVRLDEVDYFFAGPFRRILISVAGPMFNVLLSFGIILLITASHPQFNGGVIDALSVSLENVARISGVIFSGIVDLLTMNISIDSLSGPIGNTRVLGDGLERSQMEFWFMVAVMNISFAAFNMLPFPLLDGGSIVIDFFQLVFRKSIRDLDAYTYFVALFMMALVLLLIVISYGDIVKILA